MVTGLADPVLGGGARGLLQPRTQPSQPGAHSRSDLKHLGHKGKKRIAISPISWRSASPGWGLWDRGCIRPLAPLLRRGQQLFLNSLQLACVCTS